MEGAAAGEGATSSKNPKHETLNPKQIQMTEIPNPKLADSNI
jgi:hypothetical protein